MNKEYFKRMITWIVVNATVWVYMTYALAFIGREAIAESLSKQIVKVILSVPVVYGIKAAIENVFKYNKRKSKEVTDYEDQLETETNE